VKKFCYSVVLASILSACATTNQNAPSSHIDLIGNKDAVLDYWVADKKVAPKYPQRAAKKRISGCVEFSLVIDSNGKATSTKIIKAFPEGVFDIEASRAIKKWVWSPTVTNEDRKSVATTIQLDFVVRDSSNGKSAYKVCKI